MDLKEIGINKGNRVDSALDRDYWRALVECGIEPQVPYPWGYLNNCKSDYKEGRRYAFYLGLMGF